MNKLRKLGSLPMQNCDFIEHQSASRVGFNGKVLRNASPQALVSQWEVNQEPSDTC